MNVNEAGASTDCLTPAIDAELHSRLFTST